MSFGESNTDSTAKQKTTQDPYAPTIPSIQDFITSLQGFQAGNSTPSSTTTDALQQLINQAKAGNPFAGQVGDAVSSQLGATTQPELDTANAGYADYVKRMSPVADMTTQSNVLDNPQVKALVDRASQDAQDAVNQHFAAAGRSGSGMHDEAIARGVSGATLPILLQQYNTDASRADTAAGNLATAATTNATTGAGLKTAQAGIQNSGISNEPAALDAATWGPTQVAQLSHTLQNLPAEQLTQIANLLFPAAQLGGTTTGKKTGSSSTTSFGFSL